MAATADAENDESDSPKKSKLPLILGIVLALLGAGGGFFATQSGLLPFAGGDAEKAEEKSVDPKLETESVTFIPLDPITVTLPPGSDRQLLRLTAQLDVAPHNAEAIQKITPRLMDILNSYLRAVQTTDLESPTALLRLRTQMLHRVQVVAGDGVIRDLLITEFILN